MPNYNYRCECGNHFTEFKTMDARRSALCPRCGGTAEQTLSTIRAVHGFKYGWFEHMAEEPVYAANKKEMKSLCDRYGVYAPGVLD